MTAEKPSKPRIPTGLGATGKRLWGRMVGLYDFDPHEVEILEAACHQADANADLEALVADEGMVAIGSQGQRRLAGAVAEVRQGRLALGRLLGMIAIPTAAAPAKPLTEAGRRSQRAAQARWGAKKALAERRAAGETAGAD